MPKFNDVIITDGLPSNWYIQDRLDENVALLCRKSDFSITGSICVCLRPKSIPTKEWVPYARLIAEGFDIANSRDLESKQAEFETKSSPEVDSLANLLLKIWSQVDPQSGVAKYPVSYVANFADMARAAIEFRLAKGFSEIAPEPYILGNCYKTQGGDWIRLITIANEGTDYETMACIAGVHRYTKRDFGRVTGSNHDYSDPRNIPPVYGNSAVDLIVRLKQQINTKDDETYEIGKRDGYEQAAQDVDRKTGGDGEYRYCTDHDPERHVPDAAAMINRIGERFEAFNSKTMNLSVSGKTKVIATD